MGRELRECSILEIRWRGHRQLCQLLLIGREDEDEERVVGLATWKSWVTLTAMLH